MADLNNVLIHNVATPTKDMHFRARTDDDDCTVVPPKLRSRLSLAQPTSRFSGPTGSTEAFQPVYNSMLGASQPVAIPRNDYSRPPSTADSLATMSTNVSQASLQALSNLTLASDITMSTALTSGTLRSSNDSQNGAIDMSTEIEHQPQPLRLSQLRFHSRSSSFEGGQSPQKPFKGMGDWAAMPSQQQQQPASNNNMGRIPMYSTAGKLIGYRQDSSGMRSYLNPSQGNGSSGQDSGCSSPASGWSPYSSASSQSRMTIDEQFDFETAAAQPFKGFPDAENQAFGYVLGAELGKGGFCTVRKALHEATGHVVAIKIIDRERLKDPKDQDRVSREMRVMRLVAGHIYIAQLYECVETPNFVYIIMEHCAGGSLLDHVRSKKKLPEAEAAQILQQLLFALQYCHAKGVVHRDIKLENILLDSEGNVKLIDFGLSGYFVAGKKMKCHCGSPSYAAPEIVNRKEYDAPLVDVWSLGVVLFATMAGQLPFHAKEKKELSRKIVAGVYKTPSAMSSAAKDLLSKMICLDTEKRITLDQIWFHQWLKNGCPRVKPAGKGPGGLLKHNVDDKGAFVFDDEVVETLRHANMDISAVAMALRARECNSLTVPYHLLCHTKAQQRQLALAAVNRHLQQSDTPTSGNSFDSDTSRMYAIV